MKRVAVTAVTAVSILVLAGCGGSDAGSSENADTERTEKPPAECVELTADDLARLADGAKDVELTRGALIELPADVHALGVSRVVAVELDASGSHEIAVLGAGGVQAVAGPIMAADDVARKHFRWGESAQDGSMAANYRDSLAASDEAEAVRSCLE